MKNILLEYNFLIFPSIHPEIFKKGPSPMKKFIAAALVVFAVTPAFAGKMKEIFTMTEESVMDTLGFDEDVIRIEDASFTQVQGADLAVKTLARMYYSRQNAPASFDCVTTFKKTETFYSVIKTVCTASQR